jgi:hypothetical protein
MARNVYYEAPTLLAAAAQHAAAQKQRRENLDKSVDRTLEASVAQARLGQDQQQLEYGAARDAAMMNQRDREAALEFAAAQDRNTRLEQTAAADRAMQLQSQRSGWVNAGLKAGQLRYTPQQTEEMNTIDNQISQVQVDDEIAPDLKNQMIDQLMERRDRIRLTPAMVTQPPPPTPAEKSRSSTALYSPTTKRFYDHDDPEVPEDAVLAPMDRNGVVKPIMPKEQAEPKDFSAAGYYSKHENVVKRRDEISDVLTRRAQAIHAANVSQWEQRLKALTPTADDPDDVIKAKEQKRQELMNQMPALQMPTAAEIDAELRREMAASGIAPTRQPAQVTADLDFAPQQAQQPVEAPVPPPPAPQAPPAPMRPAATPQEIQPLRDRMAAIEAKYPGRTPLQYPWDDQVEYGKLAFERQAIDPEYRAQQQGNPDSLAPQAPQIVPPSPQTAAVRIKELYAKYPNPDDIPEPELQRLKELTQAIQGAE